ncbi:hypothetical protein FKR81_38125 [Lentzea tibetensis]|uniref:Proteins of 100 residues with WXG n=1 Tax=Lentzea tibetensis TaxID=2591470 RepID=A0A563EH63_9PSEU|nr:hypothetical protein [Lentzea tibetensis]TWP45794.1 hypothetical protein FKR81_38125 [Lentzea tibetensis]
MTNPIMQEVGERAEQLDQLIQKVFSKANAIVAWAPPGSEAVVGRIDGLLANLSTKIKEFWDWFDRFWTMRGDPSHLKAIALEWELRVGDRLADVAVPLDVDKLPTCFEWKGRAADAYKAIVPGQAKGLTDLQAAAYRMSDSLRSLSNAIDAFWTAVLWAIVGFSVAVTAALFAVASIAGSVVGLITMTAATAEVCAFWGAAYGVLGGAVSLAGTEFSSIKAYLATIEVENMALGRQGLAVGTEWKQPDLGRLQDATVADGDPSDWQPY